MEDFTPSFDHLESLPKAMRAFEEKESDVLLRIEINAWIKQIIDKTKTILLYQLVEISASEQILLEERIESEEYVIRKKLEELLKDREGGGFIPKIYKKEEEAIIQEVCATILSDWENS